MARRTRGGVGRRKNECLSNLFERVGTEDQLPDLSNHETDVFYLLVRYRPGMHLTAAQLTRIGKLPMPVHAWGESLCGGTEWQR